MFLFNNEKRVINSLKIKHINYEYDKYDEYDEKDKNN